MNEQIIKVRISDVVEVSGTPVEAATPEIEKDGTKIISKTNQEQGRVEAATKTTEVEATELEPNIKPENIKKGVEIFGTTGIVDDTPPLQSKTVNIYTNGEINLTPDDDYYGLDIATINVEVVPDLEEKTININKNGTETIEPSEQKDGLSKVVINTDVKPNLQEKTTFKNGVVRADANYDGLKEVNVIVEPKLQDKTVTITDKNMPVPPIVPDYEYDGLSSVDVVLDIPLNLQDRTVSITKNGTTTVKKTDLMADGLGTVTINANVAGEGDVFVQYLSKQSDKTTLFTYNGNIENELCPLFEYNSNILTINLPNARVIPANFCANASYLQKFNSSPEIIGNYSFYNASTFKGKGLDWSNVITIGARAFAGDYTFSTYGLNGAFNMPKVEEIGDYCFNNAKGMTSITLPKIKRIKEGAFQATNLQTIDLYGDYSTQISKPSDFGSFATKTFYQTPSLNSLIIRAGFFIPLENIDALNGSKIKTSTTAGFIYVPDELVETYKAATNWSTYTNKIKPISQLPA